MLPTAAPHHPNPKPLPMSLSVLAVRAFAATRALFALIGVAVVAGYLLMPHVQSQAGLPVSVPLLAVAEAPAEAAPAEAGARPAAVAESPLELEQRAVTEYIAKRYRVSDQAVAAYVSLAYQAGAQHSVDPLLILAVMAIESRYNPVAESNMGARGLMQVIPKYHLEKLLDHGGEPALLEPAVNIMVGAQILREYQRRFRDTETALQMYAGALDDVTTQYASKVFAEKARLDALRVKTKRTGQSA
jgi:soluble lytic murein transglycosylase-like protein